MKIVDKSKKGKEKEKREKIKYIKSHVEGAPIDKEKKMNKGKKFASEGQIHRGALMYSPRVARAASESAASEIGLILLIIDDNCSIINNFMIYCRFGEIDRADASQIHGGHLASVAARSRQQAQKGLFLSPLVLISSFQVLGATTGAELAVMETAPMWLLPERRSGRDLPRFAQEFSVIQ